jgi:ubiquinone/menaquinone biosynthesis C-methylase UbiE
MSEAINPDVVTQFEHATWSRCARSYLDTFAGLTRQTIPLLLEAAGIRRGSQVLEIGSGPGHVAQALTEAGAVVTGVDFSAQMIAVAQYHSPQITFREANAEQLPFEVGTFNAVVSNFVVHHLARPTVVFQEVCRVLKPGGCFAFVVFGAPEAQSSIGAFFRAVQAHHTLEALPNGPLFGVTDRSLYEPLIMAGGLVDFQLDTHEIAWRSATLDPMLRGFWDWGNMTALPQEVQRQIEATARENAQPYHQHGQFVFPHTILLGRAVKPAGSK